MTVNINRNPAQQPKEATRRIPASPYSKRLGIWGRVEASYSDDNSVDVFLDTGMYLNRVPVTSKEWIVPGEDAEKDFNSGERDLPPLKARVFVFMPTFTFSDCFIAPFSGFDNTDRNMSSPFLADDKQKIKERITPSGWHITDDYVTGSHKSVSPDKKTSLEIDYGNEEEAKEAPELHLNLFDNIKVDVIADEVVSLSVFDEVKIKHEKEKTYTVKVFDTELEIMPGKVRLKPKETAIEVDGNALLKTTGNTNIEANGNVDVKGTNVTVEASALLTLKTGDATAFCPNIVPMCPLGPIHGGKPAGIMKLVGG
jgi:hypothetical protein